MIDVSELLADPDFARRLTLRRPRATTFTNEGEAQAAYGEESIVGVVQPASAAELKIMPEGSRLDDVLSVWSAEELRTGDGKTTEPDVLVIDRKSYKVVKCEPWPDNGYWRAFAEGFVTP